VDSHWSHEFFQVVHWEKTEEEAGLTFTN